jgi:hypothetical protein
MSDVLFETADLESRHAASVLGALMPSPIFRNHLMTALSLQLVNTSQNRKKMLDSPVASVTTANSAAWNTDLYDKKIFNNQKFDSAVFLRSSDFKRHHKTHLH